MKPYPFFFKHYSLLSYPTSQTLAMGVPLITALYEDNPSLGSFTLPLLIWHPVQLVLGSVVSPRLEIWTEKEIKRLGLENDDTIAEAENIMSEDNYSKGENFQDRGEEREDNRL